LKLENSLFTSSKQTGIKKENDCDEKSDAWSIEAISYLLLSGEAPFGGLDGENLMIVRQPIICAHFRFQPDDVWDKVSEDGRNFVKLLLNLDSTSRPSAKEAQLNPWIRVWA
jgi:serine/threonine protein kinase